MSATGIRQKALSVEEAIAAVQHVSAGGIATFLGVVRNHANGMVVEKLEYHAYTAMAETELRAVADELEKEFPGSRLACFHRIGMLAVGDAAVVCAVSSAHRDDAFQACRELIDRVKGRVPIWKREHGPDGPYWVGWKDARAEPQANSQSGLSTPDQPGV